MSYRYMRVIALFDLPTLSAKQRRNYTKFRKHLLKSGFMMMQESVYSKLALNPTAADAITANIRKNKPSEGLVQVMTITEKQFAKIEFIVGESVSTLINSDERLIVL